jgi:hypothetical protein
VAAFLTGVKAIVGIAVGSIGEEIAAGIEFGGGFFREVSAQAVENRQIKIVKTATGYRYIATNRL